MLIGLITVLSVLSLRAEAAPATGACLCVTGSNVNVRDAPGTTSHIVASVSSGQCFKFNGGVLTKDNYVWYELQNVAGHPRAWIASNYVHESAASSCTTSSGGTGGATGSFATGLVSQQCLQCICTQESQCKPIGCHFDVNSDSCGYFQIKHDYWLDCGSPGGSWQSCANDLHCASQCVQAYMKKYVDYYHCPHTCEGYAREHNGGPQGCHHSSTLGYWREVQSHSGCSGVQ